MSQITVGSNSQFSIDDINVAELRDIDVISTSPTLRKLGLNADTSISIIGTGFTFDAGGDFTGGTITALQVLDNGAVGFQFNGISVAASTFRAAVESSADGASTALFTQIFGGDDEMTGAGDDDIFRGFGGNDNIFGGAGRDTLVGGAGNDHLYGQSATGGTDGADSLSGDEGSDYLQGNAGNDTLDGGTGSDRILGGQGDDNALGGDGNDSINGNLGNDTLSGGAGNDLLRGGQGNDSIAGGDGADQLSGDLGADVLTGGAGVDYFLFSGSASLVAAPDRVTDYADGVDRLFVGYTVNAVLTGAVQPDAAAAATAAQALFDGRAGNGEVAALQVGTETHLFYSSNGGVSADSVVILADVSAGLITTSDFL